MAIASIHVYEGNVVNEPNNHHLKVVNFFNETLQHKLEISFSQLMS